MIITVESVGATVAISRWTACPIRGSSERMNSCSDCSSSTNRMRRLLCGGGVANGHLLDFGGRRGQRQPDDERTAVPGAGAGRFDFAAVLADDPVADRQAQ